jgi:hypothetical protein
MLHHDDGVLIIVIKHQWLTVSVNSISIPWKKQMLQKMLRMDLENP